MINRGRTDTRSITRLAAALAAIGIALLLAAPAQGAGGTWERAWGKDVDSVALGSSFEICTVATSCQAGQAGVLGGELNVPSAAATDAAGNLYVTDFFNRRVEKFDSSGNFLLAWGTDVASAGPGNIGTGFFEICVAANGDTCKAGANSGTGLGGELSFPAGVATDATGSVYVSDSGGNRIQMFDSSGNFLRTWGRDVRFDGGTGFEICNAAIACKWGVAGGRGGELRSPAGLATVGASALYVVDQGNQRIQKFDLPSGGDFLRAWGRDVSTFRGTGFEICTRAVFLETCQTGAAGELGGELNGPVHAATDAAGNVYVADELNGRIQKFDSSGNFLRAWGKDVDMSGGTGFEICTARASCKAGFFGGLGGELFSPRGVASDAAGNLYVADTGNHRIQKFDSSGGFLRSWGKGVLGGTGFEICTAATSCRQGQAGGLGGEFFGPVSTATDAGGDLYVVEQTNRRIQKFAGGGEGSGVSGGEGASTLGSTGQRAAALKKCKKKFPKGPRRKKCLRKARKLPV